MIVIMLNAQFDEVDEVSQGFNGSFEQVVGQVSACNGCVV